MSGAIGAFDPRTQFVVALRWSFSLRSRSNPTSIDPDLQNHIAPMRNLLATFILALVSVVAAVSQVGQRASGRDWFVRAGADGGDGTVERPFADPWQALEACEAGDRVHVARGVYTGQLDAGTWVIPFERVALDADPIGRTYFAFVGVEVSARTPFEPCMRFSRTRLTGDLSDVCITRPPDT